MSTHRIQDAWTHHAALSRAHAMSQLDSAGATHGAAFASALDAVSAHGVTNRLQPGGEAATQRPIESTASYDALARHFDEIERHRVEANSLPGRIARAYESGALGNDVAVAMHRQAREMAAYNLNVMWSAKVVGVTASAIKQLIAAT